MKKILVPLLTAAALNLAVADTECNDPQCATDHNHDHTHQHNPYGCQDGCRYGYSEFFLVKNVNEQDFGGHLCLEVVTEKTYRAPEAEEEINNTFAHAHLDTYWQITKNLRLDGRLNLEEAHDHGHHHEEGEEEEHGGGNRFFDEHQLAMEELYLSYNWDENFLFYTGKFNPEVGFNYHAMPGYLGYQQLEEYAIKEKVGVGMKYRLATNNLGTYILNGSFFQSDRSFLSGSLLNEREHNNIEDGGPANHSGLRSYAVTLKNKPYSFKLGSIHNNFNWQVGYARQAGAEEDFTAETRTSISAQHVIDFTSSLQLRGVFEVVDITNYYGEDGHDQQVATGGAELKFNRWEIGGSYTHIDNSAEEAEEGANAWSYQGSIGYYLTTNLCLQLGMKKTTEHEESKESAGIALLYAVDF